MQDLTEHEAMDLMVEGGFQEEREEALKWTRAQLSFTQLSTYMVGYLEHKDLQAEVYQEWGEQYMPRKYHDRLLSFGSPPVKYARPHTNGFADENFFSRNEKH